MTGLAIGSSFLISFGLGFGAFIAVFGFTLLMRLRGAVGPVSTTAIVIASLAGAIWAQSSSPTPTTDLMTGGFEGVVRVAEGPFLTASGQRFVGYGRSTREERVCIYAGPTPKLHRGDRIFLSGRLIAPVDLAEIGNAALRARNCSAQLNAETMVVVEPGHGLVSALSRVRVNMSAFLMQAAPGDAGALLSGLVTGDDGGLSGGARDAFLASGTIHITAISGANFSVLILLLGVMATGAMKRSLWFVGAATSAVWLFAIMVGLQPSALRAALLATAALLGRWLGRAPDLLTLTVLLAAIQISFRPHDFWTLGFQLSIAATVALIVVFDGSERFGARSAGASLALSVVAAQLATLPILAATIGTLNGIGLFANLLIGPLASLVFPIALVGASIGFAAPWIGEMVLLPAIWLSGLMVDIVELADRYLPGAVQLGRPVPAAIAVLTVACWSTIFALSGDLRRMGRHAVSLVRNW